MVMRKSIIAVVCLLCAHFSLTLYCIQANSPTCDEVAHHVASGYSYLKTGDFRMNPANPPLVREISALPLLFLRLNAPFERQSWHEGNSSVFGNEFFYKLGNDPELITFWSRVPIALLSVLLGLLVFIWSSQLFGVPAGLLSLGLYSFSPNIMAFASLASVDLGASFFIFAAFFAFYRYLEKPTKIRLLIAGLSFGLAQAAKFTSILLLPIFAILFFMQFLASRSRTKEPYLYGFIKGAVFLCLLCAIGYAIVYGAYFFETKPLLHNAPDLQEKIDYVRAFVDRFSLGRFGLTKEAAVNIATKAPIPLSAYIVGLLGIIHQGSVGLDTFLLGRHSQSGFWNYFLIAWLAKTTLPVLMVFFASLLYMAGERKDFYKKAFLLLPVIIFFVLISRSKVQVGLRHLLPIYPLMFVFIGQITLIKMRDKVKNLLSVFLIGGQFLALMVAYPYPIAYFNRLAGGPKNGYKILRDSNIDWGQGLKALAQYVKESGISRIKLYYFGTADPKAYNIPYDEIATEEFWQPGKGVYAISVQYLDAFKWTSRFEPVDRVAHSIFIYKF
jgi:4-amino-4-deoxy-L-arabinose transferase-like glycosyltransferase